MLSFAQLQFCILGEDVMAKQVLVMRKDLKMKGKAIAQGSHGSLGVFLKMMNDGKSLKESTPEIKNGKYTLSLDIEVGSPIDEWLRGIHRKIAVSVNSEDELMEVYQKALDKGIPAHLVIDSGLTRFNGVPTKTCVALGPCDDDQFQGLTDHLSLY